METKKEIEKGKVLDSILQKNAANVRQLDVQANILLGLCSALFMFSITKAYGQEFSLPVVILAIFTGVAALMSLYSIHPPKRMRHKGQQESLFSKAIPKFPTDKEYGDGLREMFKEEDKVVEQYALEIYNIDKFYYRPKRKLFNYARNILIAGIFLSLVAFIATFFSYSFF